MLSIFHFSKNRYDLEIINGVHEQRSKEKMRLLHQNCVNENGN